MSTQPLPSDRSYQQPVRAADADTQLNRRESLENGGSRYYFEPYGWVGTIRADRWEVDADEGPWRGIGTGQEDSAMK